MSPFATLAIAACKRAIAAVKDWGAPCGFINKNPCSRFLRNATRSSAKRIAKESTPASWQRSGAVAIPWSAVWVVSSLPIGEIPFGKMSCADDLAGTAEAPHIADAIRCGAERFSLVPQTYSCAAQCRHRALLRDRNSPPQFPNHCCALTLKAQ